MKSYQCDSGAFCELAHLSDGSIDARQPCCKPIRISVGTVRVARARVVEAQYGKTNRRQLLREVTLRAMGGDCLPSDRATKDDRSITR